ncbi:hypothetical protein CK203_090806 [Vitis vinifera]|uniref:TRF2/HOY1 PH-like domain-containing protein n=1 Tax=Vitis vinifera TaxID=29760 RepID=A0A438BU23_VITVI|nr:hypothetical protein CK203_090806 [Vitis vinifera]
MVQLMKSGSLRPERETTPCRDKLPVKLEIEDSLEEEHGPFNKRSKPSTSYQQWSTGNNAYPIPPSQYNPLDEPSPLGLRLRKSPSLLDLIQMRLSQGNPSNAGCAPNKGPNPGDKKDPGKGNMALGTDKLKASNFPASLLRIGRWEYASRYEGDLVAKCYFAKHKLVWEVLEGGLKSKIEIQWSDIMALKANCPDDGPGTLNVVLARQPLFFRETNPQPRKHTLWQATADFTDGQASIHSHLFHLLVVWCHWCAKGGREMEERRVWQWLMMEIVGTGFEVRGVIEGVEFMDCGPEIVLDSPYFERVSVFEDPDESKVEGFDQLESVQGSTISGFQDVASPTAAQSSSLKIEPRDPVGLASENLSRESPSPSSEQMTSGNPALSEEGVECQGILEDIAQYLLSDSQFTAASDEKSLMSRVNSLCCLLQKDPGSVQNLQMNGEGCFEELDEKKDVSLTTLLNQLHENKAPGDITVPEGDSKDVTGYKQAPAMSRKDSFGDLLLHLPRITSLPKFLFNISEDDENQAR